MYIYVYIHIYIHVHIYICIHIHIYTYVYVYIYTYIHTYIHTYTDTTGQSWNRVSRPRGTGSVGDNVGEGIERGRGCKGEERKHSRRHGMEGDSWRVATVGGLR